MLENNQPQTSPSLNNQDATLPRKESVVSKSKSRFVLMAIIAATVIGLMLMLGVGAAVWYLIDKTTPVSVLSVQGKSSKKIAYDQVSVNLTISLVGSNVEALNTEIDTKTVKLLDYLKSQNVAENQIQTNKSSYPDYDQPNYPIDATNPMVSPVDLPEPTGFTPPSIPTNPISKPAPVPSERKTRVENNFIITFTDFAENPSKPNKVVSEATKLGVNRFGSFNYNFKDNKAVCQELENEATKDAFNRATDRIKSLGGGRIVKRTTNLLGSCGGSNYPIYEGYNMMAKVDSIASSSNPVPTLLGGQQELFSMVELTVEYK